MKVSRKVAPPQIGKVNSDWSPPQDFPEGWLRARRISIDFETQDVELKSRGPSWGRNGDGFICGVAFAVDDDAPRYYPVKHGGRMGSAEYGNVDWGRVQMFLRDVAESDVPKVIANEEYERGWLKQIGIELRGRVDDPLRAAPLIDENRMPGQYNLDALAKDWIRAKKDEKLLRAAASMAGLDPKRDLWQLHSKYVGYYAEQDAKLNLRLWDYCEEQIEKQDLWKAYELESALVPILVEMRFRGVRIDVNASERLLGLIHDEYIRFRDSFRIKHGIALPDENSGQQIAAVADKQGLSYPKTDLGNPSFPKAFLEASQEPIFQGIKYLRDCAKIESLVRGQLDHMVQGRIHTSLQPLKGEDGGTITFRFSSKSPNLQQVPSRGMWGKLVRSIYLPEEGAEWGKADYSEQEYRLIVHYAHVLHLPRAAEAVQRYKDGYSFHNSTAEWLGWNPDEYRWKAKILNFGMAYAMGKHGVAGNLGCSPEEAQEVLDQYHEKVPFVKALDLIVQRQAQKKGYIELFGGHHCHFDLWELVDWDLRKEVPPMSREQLQKSYPGQKIKRAFLRKALNKLIQGSGAGMIKRAMVELAKEDQIAMLQVHDELDWSIESDAQASRICEVMRDVGSELSVPFKVDIDLGPTWAGASFDEVRRAM